MFPTLLQLMQFKNAKVRFAVLIRLYCSTVCTRGGGETGFYETRRDEILDQKSETRRDVSRDTLNLLYPKFAQQIVTTHNGILYWYQ